MITHDLKPLGVREAAQLIYQTSQPTPTQIHRVRARLKSGALKGTLDNKGCWTTTSEQVARYLAEQSVYQEIAKRDAVSKTRRLRQMDQSGPGTLDRAAARRLSSAYRDVLRDYFLALIMRRKMRDRSQWFQRCVLAGQAIIVLALFLRAATAFRASFGMASPERALVERWIAETAGSRYQIIRWYPVEASADGAGVIVPVEYRYFRKGGKPIETDRRFLVVGDEVRQLDSDG